MTSLKKSSSVFFLCLVFLSATGCSTAKRSSQVEPETMSEKVQPEKKELSMGMKVVAYAVGFAIGHSLAKAATDD